MIKPSKAKGIALLFALLALVVVALAVLPGCGGESPGQAVKRHLELLNDRHFDEFFDSHVDISPAERQQIIQVQETAFPAGAQISDIKILREEVSDGSATVEVSYVKELPGVPDEPVRATVELVKENGQPWKILRGI